MTEMKKSTKYYIYSGVFLGLFVVLLMLLLFVDRKPVGFNNTDLGLSTLNKTFLDFVGSSHFAKVVSDVLGYVSIAFGLVFVGLFLYKWIKNKSLKKVEIGLFNLMVYYAVLALIYVVFLFVCINTRPTSLEASFPSSHTILILAILSTGAIYLQFLTNNKKVVNGLGFFLIFLMVVGVVCRLLSGVHYFTDILGSVFLGGAMFFALIATNWLFTEKYLEEQKQNALKENAEKTEKTEKEEGK